jgi:voltage-gated sodium channel
MFEETEAPVSQSEGERAGAATRRSGSLYRTFMAEEEERERASRVRTQSKTSAVTEAVGSVLESMDFVGRCHSPTGEEQQQSTSIRGLAKALVTSRGFDLTFCILILSNTLLFGIEAEYLAETRQLEAPFVLKFLAISYTIAFAIEFLLRLYAFGYQFFCSTDSGWNILDSVIVALSLVELLVFMFEKHGSLTLAEADHLSYMRMLRVARTARLLRVVRIVSFFRALRLLLMSVMNTFKSLFWTVVLLLIILYMFGVMFTQAATQHLVVETYEIVGLSKYYGTLYLSVYTLFKTITNGMDWEYAVEPLTELGGFWAFLFNVYIAFTYFAVLNVVTGVFCQTAIESAVKDQDEVMLSMQDKKKVFIDQLTELFNDVDANGSGDLTIDEFEILLQDERLVKYCASLDITIDDAWALFKLLDKDGSGDIGVNEFVTGCLRLQGSARSVDLALAAYQLQWLIDRFEKFIQYSDGQFRDIRTLVDPKRNGSPTSRNSSKQESRQDSHRKDSRGRSGASPGTVRSPPIEAGCHGCN